MSRAIWQLEATFATSQSCRKKAIASPDLCSPMTNNATLPTLFSSCLPARLPTPHFRPSTPGSENPPDVGVEGLAVWHKGRLLLHQQEQKLAMRLDAHLSPPKPEATNSPRRSVTPSVAIATHGCHTLQHTALKIAAL